MATTIDKDGDGSIEIDEIRRFFYQLWRRRLSEMDEAIASVDLERELERGGGTKAADPALRTQLDHAQRQRDSLRAVLSTNFPRHFRDELAQTMSSPGGGEGMFGQGWVG